MNTLEENLHKISNDNISGSLMILSNVINALSSHFADTTAISSTDAKEYVTNLLTNYWKKNNQFAVVTHFINQFLTSLNKQQTTDEQILRKNCLSFINEYQNRWKNADGKAVANFMEKIPLVNKTILLHSNSTTIIKLFEELAAKKTPLTIFQCEARPMMEGRKQAIKLTQAGFNVNLIIDAAVGKYLNVIDMVIMGADAITDTHTINKIGSYNIALLCSKKNKPVYVIGESRKMISNSYLAKEKKKNPQEIWDQMNENIIPLNYYFDETPNELITKFILDFGVLNYFELKNYFAEKQEELLI
ncbi:hypothetical protein JYT51_00600 [Candidatus Amoebophilus asiaticus]|nr:hypothetical protein [Candidatus Amoebophilus asiaticus]